MPILVLTNSYLSQVALEASTSGATEVFDKATTTPAQLIEALGKALSCRPKQRRFQRPQSQPRLRRVQRPFSLEPARLRRRSALNPHRLPQSMAQAASTSGFTVRGIGFTIHCRVAQTIPTADQGKQRSGPLEQLGQLCRRI